MKKTSKGHLAWAGLISYIVAYDAFAIKTNRVTLSGAFSSGMSHKTTRVALLAVWFILTKHLTLGNYGRKYDPIQLAADRLRERWDG